MRNIFFSSTQVSTECNVQRNSCEWEIPKKNFVTLQLNQLKHVWCVIHCFSLIELFQIPHTCHRWGNISADTTKSENVYAKLRKLKFVNWNVSSTSRWPYFHAINLRVFLNIPPTLFLFFVSYHSSQWTRLSMNYDRPIIQSRSIWSALKSLISWGLPSWKGFQNYSFSNPGLSYSITKLLFTVHLYSSYSVHLISIEMISQTELLETDWSNSSMRHQWR